MQQIVLDIRGVEYRVEVYETEDIVGFDIYRNGKNHSSTTLPYEMADELKMAIYEKLVMFAMYDISYAITSQLNCE